MEHISVRPVLYINVETIPPANTKGGKLIIDVQKYAKERQYLEAPSAWFVPIADLKTRIDDVADYLHFDTLYHHEFEIGGGFEIISQDGSLGLPPGASFACAVEMAEAVINMQDNDNKQVCIDNDHFIKFSLEKDSIKMAMGHIAKYIPKKEIVVPAKKLKSQMETARNELLWFSSQLEPLIVQFSDFHVSSRLVKFMFGLEKQNLPKEKRA
jgi:hypothetical protein